MSDMNGEIQEMGKGQPDDQPVEVTAEEIEEAEADHGQP